MVAQRLQQVHDERVGPGHLRLQEREQARMALRGPPLLLQLHQARPARFGFAALGPGVQHLVGKTAQILDDSQPQHDRHGPEFADQERRDRLISPDEARDVGLVQATIRVSN